MDKQILLKHLTEGICQVTFSKVKDNTTRTIYCTLVQGIIPSKYEKSVEKVFTESTSDTDIIPIWDVAEGKWKSFRLSKLSLFITADELTKENKKAYSGKSEIEDREENVKKQIIEDFNKRVEELKQKALEAKQNINGDNDNEEGS